MNSVMQALMSRMTPGQETGLGLQPPPMKEGVAPVPLAAQPTMPFQASPLKQPMNRPPGYVNPVLLHRMLENKG